MAVPSKDEEQVRLGEGLLKPPLLGENSPHWAWRGRHRSQSWAVGRINQVSSKRKDKKRQLSPSPLDSVSQKNEAL